jgi:hypothetical protein
MLQEKHQQDLAEQQQLARIKVAQEIQRMQLAAEKKPELKKGK